MREFERRVVLSVLDRKWREHLYEMDYLREGVSLRGYGQRDPLIEYQREGYDMFTTMMEGIKEESVGSLFNLQVQVQQNPIVAGGRCQWRRSGSPGQSAPAQPAAPAGPPAVSTPAGLAAAASPAALPGQRRQARPAPARAAPAVSSRLPTRLAFRPASRAGWPGRSARAAQLQRAEPRTRPGGPSTRPRLGCRR